MLMNFDIRGVVTPHKVPTGKTLNDEYMYIKNVVNI